MFVVTYLVIALVAYLLGSIPFGYVLVRLFRKEDIRETGSGNIGATNVIRSGAKGLGALTFLLDALKGYVAVMAAGWLLNLHVLQLVPLQDAMAVAAMAAITGHIFPVWLSFRGGKGVATAFGVFVAVAWLAAVAALVMFLIIFALTRYVSLASILGAASFPVFAFLTPHFPYSGLMIAVILIVPAIIIAKHHQNIHRLLRGTEYRFGKTKASEA
ncbi:glycerol-3-phosphate 1-O-acyltransferase PlsY [Alloacidobacterium dinghuense]|uniref:Glycerol-3-phosphate acyltransferase n=1 Tax=Alloacidobacterium dinghuense TaxID=2763107 RepID=A0A7G8BJ76_9BACT|nr:glycerol-3-phosphate 1-O-acyltransferase PlsY [Alloacidobacterium dinghuense]QNI32596.1 glycerol-3-phosphate 1-O-acyltransferase PlsY [Alloacidobacterium dinghuense]